MIFNYNLMLSDIFSSSGIFPTSGACSFAGLASPSWRSWNLSNSSQIFSSWRHADSPGALGEPEWLAGYDVTQTRRTCKEVARDWLIMTSLDLVMCMRKAWIIGWSWRHVDSKDVHEELANVCFKDNLQECMRVQIKSNISLRMVHSTSLLP